MNACPSTRASKLHNLNSFNQFILSLSLQKLTSPTHKNDNNPPPTTTRPSNSRRLTNLNKHIRHPARPLPTTLTNPLSKHTQPPRNIHVSILDSQHLQTRLRCLSTTVTLNTFILAIRWPTTSPPKHSFLQTRFHYKNASIFRFRTG